MFSCSFIYFGDSVFLIYFGGEIGENISTAFAYFEVDKCSLLSCICLGRGLFFNWGEVVFVLLLISFFADDCSFGTFNVSIALGSTNVFAEEDYGAF